MLHPNSTLYSYYKTKKISLSINIYIDFDICTYGTKRNPPAPATCRMHVQIITWKPAIESKTKI